MKLENILKSLVIAGLLTGVAGMEAKAQEDKCDTVTIDARPTRNFQMMVNTTSCEGQPNTFVKVLAGDKMSFQVKHGTDIDIQSCNFDNQGCKSRGTHLTLDKTQIQRNVTFTCHGEDYSDANCDPFGKEKK
jgi:hypothetical protein